METVDLKKKIIEIKKSLDDLKSTGKRTDYGLMSLRTDQWNVHNVKNREHISWGEEVLRTRVGQFKNSQCLYNWGPRRRKQSKWG